MLDGEAYFVDTRLGEVLRRDLWRPQGPSKRMARIHAISEDRSRTSPRGDELSEEEVLWKKEIGLMGLIGRQCPTCPTSNSFLSPTCL